MLELKYKIRSNESYENKISYIEENIEYIVPYFNKRVSAEDLTMAGVKTKFKRI